MWPWRACGRRGVRGIGVRGIGVRGRGMRGIGVRAPGVPAVRVCQRRAWGSAAAAVCGSRRAVAAADVAAAGWKQCGSSDVEADVQERRSAPRRWSARRRAGPASSEGARHVNMRLIRGMRTWRASIRSHAARARSSMHAQHAGSSHARARAPQRSREQSASAPRSSAASAMWKQPAGAPRRWSARRHAGPASSEGARHVIIGLCNRGRGRGVLPLGRNSQLQCTRVAHATRFGCRRAHAAVQQGARQAHRDLERHHHAGANEGTAKQLELRTA